MCKWELHFSKHVKKQYKILDNYLYFTENLVFVTRQLKSHDIKVNKFNTCRCLLLQLLSVM